MANQNSDKKKPSGSQSTRDPQHEGRADQNRIQQTPDKLNQSPGQGQPGRDGQQNRPNPQGQDDRR